MVGTEHSRGATSASVLIVITGLSSIYGSIRGSSDGGLFGPARISPLPLLFFVVVS